MTKPTKDDIGNALKDGASVAVLAWLRLMKWHRLRMPPLSSLMLLTNEDVLLCPLEHGHGFLVDALAQLPLLTLHLIQATSTMQMVMLAKMADACACEPIIFSAMCVRAYTALMLILNIPTAM